MTTELRWILLAIGAAVVLIVWLLSRRRPKDGPPELNEVVQDPVDLDAIEEVGRALGREIRGGEAPSMLLVVHVRAAVDIAPEPLTAALESVGLRFGRMDIYHEMDGDREVFSVASMLEPGVFEDRPTPGVSMFAILDGAGGGIETYERMLACARALATSLDAEVLDESREPQGAAMEYATREAITRFEKGG